MTRRASSSPDAVDLILEQWKRELPSLDASPMEVLGRLHRSFLRYQGLLSDLFDCFDLNMAAFDVLAALRRSGPPYRRTAGELADISLVTTGGITLRLDRLEKAGLVTRERDPGDRRVVYARLTDRGIEIADVVAVAHFANEERMLAELTGAERRQLGRLLGKLERSLETAERTPSDPGTATGVLGRPTRVEKPPAVSI
ncbi:MarR family winged helix-turn-helix transcriptional regulator [Streptomyces sp. NBC_01637]|uniref:MarR family winged helix-turn-helix transcriptional regulator n=1 Tax=unclassified Streptomyces TaxID=2593676 RepID=UPI00386E9457|nr:MarR family transcriptional regulator [Streptomyces sp. NBC_01653]WTD91565.1 MarR family transcriptional regulator [Streptomyces sp. NBC_01637]